MPEISTTAADRLSEAAAAVDEAHFRGTDGRAVRQTTDTMVILRHLRIADIEPGDRVLEIGTGSGLSTALLAELVGPHGHVVSVDLLPELTERAARLHAEAGYANVTFLARDGLDGAPKHGPYTRIVAWTCPPRLPDAWLDQATVGAVMLHPLPVARLAYSTVMLRSVVAESGTPTTPSVHRGAYARMGGTVHQARESDDANATSVTGYVSAEWLHSRPAQHAVDLLGRLEAAAHSEPVDLSWPDCDDLRAWLIAQRPEGLISAGRDRAVGYGIATEEHVALLEMLPHSQLIADSAQSPALERLRELLHTWTSAGRPGTDTLTPHLHRITDGWQATL
ncbi:methyltransferase domain-containing protein [Lipingzhangella sp. LS1_29]|uniref:Protein-L-isoaspartate O-methyltransferase n=1 Tax=Lipingzhangella rawalii TaxID=2055835 RepID=A0ABU2H185_9ACTN|nr:methyltransferase domain-containing protein [Lipingzhangella rawalii]MDS1269063.1 methyltransferase domain-containing protein [Lipingzhangella rawalii]